MSKERNKQIFKLQLLAFVLALSLAWYSLNPAPAPVVRLRREDELPDEKKRKVEPQIERAARLSAAFGLLEEETVASRPAGEDEDDFDWPEFIDG